MAAQQSVQVKLELGHHARNRKKPTPEGYTHHWQVFVRGPEEKFEIKHFVEKVVFHLYEDFPNPKRSCKEPPYEVEENGYGGFVFPIDVYFKNKSEPRKIRFNYDLRLPPQGAPPVYNVRVEKLTFQNPTEEFRAKLLQAGGIGIPGPGEVVAPGPAVAPPSSKSMTTAATTPQTPESTAFADLFGPSSSSSSSSKHSSHHAEKHKHKKSSTHTTDKGGNESTSSSQAFMESPKPVATVINVATKDKSELKRALEASLFDDVDDGGCIEPKIAKKEEDPLKSSERHKEKHRSDRDKVKTEKGSSTKHKVSNVAVSSDQHSSPWDDRGSTSTGESREKDKKESRHHHHKSKHERHEKSHRHGERSSQKTSASSASSVTGSKTDGASDASKSRSSGGESSRHSLSHKHSSSSSSKAQDSHSSERKLERSIDPSKADNSTGSKGSSKDHSSKRGINTPELMPMYAATLKSSSSVAESLASERFVVREEVAASHVEQVADKASRGATQASDSIVVGVAARMLPPVNQSSQLHSLLRDLDSSDASSSDEHDDRPKDSQSDRRSDLGDISDNSDERGANETSSRVAAIVPFDTRLEDVVPPTLGTVQPFRSSQSVVPTSSTGSIPLHTDLVPYPDSHKSNVASGKSSLQKLPSNEAKHDVKSDPYG